MSDPVDELLERFRADVPEPDEAQLARAFEAIARGPRQRRRHRRPARVPVLASLGAVAAAVAAAAVLVVMRVDSAPDSATIIGGVIASKSSSRWLLYSQVRQVLPTNGARVCELWSTNDGTGEFREITTIGSARVAAAGQYKPRRGYIVGSDGLAYVANEVLDFAALELKSWAGDPRRLLADSSARAWRISDSSFEGRPTYLLESKQRTTYGGPVATFVVDRDSLAPIRAEVEVSIARCGIPQLINFDRGHTTTAIYRYLQPTPANLKLLRLRAPGGVHPAAMLPNALADALGRRHVEGGDPGSAATVTSPNPGDLGGLNEP
jgi:hypothetical protein